MISYEALAPCQSLVTWWRLSFLSPISSSATLTLLQLLNFTFAWWVRQSKLSLFCLTLGLVSYLAKWRSWLECQLYKYKPKVVSKDQGDLEFIRNAWKSVKAATGGYNLQQIHWMTTVTVVTCLAWFIYLLTCTCVSVQKQKVQAKSCLL